MGMVRDFLYIGWEMYGADCRVPKPSPVWAFIFETFSLNQTKLQILWQLSKLKSLMLADDWVLVYIWGMERWRASFEWSEKDGHIRNLRSNTYHTMRIW